MFAIIIYTMNNILDHDSFCQLRNTFIDLPCNCNDIKIIRKNEGREIISFIEDYINKLDKMIPIEDDIHHGQQLIKLWSMNILNDVKIYIQNRN